MASYKGAYCNVDSMPGNCGMAVAEDFHSLPKTGKNAKEVYKGLFTEILAESDNPALVVVTDKVGGAVEKFAKANGFTRNINPVKNRHTGNNIVMYTRRVTKAEYEAAVRESEARHYAQRN